VRGGRRQPTFALGMAMVLGSALLYGDTVQLSDPWWNGEPEFCKVREDLRCAPSPANRWWGGALAGSGLFVAVAATAGTAGEQQEEDRRDDRADGRRVGVRPAARRQYCRRVVLGPPRRVRS
jgi:hypothetical protein